MYVYAYMYIFINSIPYTKYIPFLSHTLIYYGDNTSTTSTTTSLHYISLHFISFHFFFMFCFTFCRWCGLY